MSEYKEPCCDKCLYLTLKPDHLKQPARHCMASRHAYQIQKRNHPCRHYNNKFLAILDDKESEAFEKRQQEQD